MTGVGRYSPLGAVRRGIKRGDIPVTEKTNLEDRFWGGILAKMIRATGLAVRPSQYELAAARLVKDIAAYRKENPWAEHYYEAELDRAIDNLGKYTGRPLTKGEDLLVRMLNGVSSNSTDLRFNTFESVNGLRLFRQQGNLDGFNLRESEKQKGAMSSEGLPQPYSVTGGAIATKIGHLQKLNDIIKARGVEDTAKLMRQEFTWPELVKLRKDLGWKSSMDKGPVLEQVKFATDQDVRIPGAFVFGTKVGPYMLNNLGDLRYNTTDTWESRIIASQFKGMLQRNTGLLQGVDEHQLFLKTVKAFNRIWREKY